MIPKLYFHVIPMLFWLLVTLINQRGPMQRTKQYWQKAMSKAHNSCSLRAPTKIVAALIAISMLIGACLFGLRECQNLPKALSSLCKLMKEDRLGTTIALLSVFVATFILITHGTVIKKFPFKSFAHTVRFGNFFVGFLQGWGLTSLKKINVPSRFSVQFNYLQIRGPSRRNSGPIKSDERF